MLAKRSFVFTAGEIIKDNVHILSYIRLVQMIEGSDNVNMSDKCYFMLITAEVVGCTQLILFIPFLHKQSIP